MFCIKSNVITLGPIEMYGLVWTMGPIGSFYLCMGSHDMRHTGFRRLTLVNETPGFWGWGVTHVVSSNTMYLSTDIDLQGEVC